MMDAIKLHIGGTQRKDGWKILNIQSGPDVDFVGSCTDLSMFGNETIDEVYASHVIEHLQPQTVQLTLSEFQRILKPGGLLKLSVPDLDVLCRLYLDAADNLSDQIFVVNMIYGGHQHEFDIHHFGFNFNLMFNLLVGAKFSTLKRVDNFAEFEDTSSTIYRGVPISLNLIAQK